MESSVVWVWLIAVIAMAGCSSEKGSNDIQPFPARVWCAVEDTELVAYRSPGGAPIDAFYVRGYSAESNVLVLGQLGEPRMEHGELISGRELKSVTGYARTERQRHLNGVIWHEFRRMSAEELKEASERD